MEMLRKYNTAHTIYFPLLDATTGELKSGISFAAGDVQFSEDGAAFANANGTPTDEGNGFYSLALLNTETAGAVVMISIIDQTSPKVWVDQAIIISTYGNASAQHAFDLDAATPDVNVASMNAGTVTASAVATGAIDADSIAANAITAAKIATDAITNAKIAADAIGASEIAADAIGAAEIADNAIDAATFATDTDSYQAKVWMVDDDGAGTPADRYMIVWYKNGEPVTSGITSPTIQVIKVADGTDLVTSSAMTQIASLGMYRYDETTNRIADGAAYVVKCEATIGGSTRTWYQPISRDSS